MARISSNTHYPGIQVNITYGHISALIYSQNGPILGPLAHSSPHLIQYTGSMVPGTGTGSHVQMVHGIQGPWDQITYMDLYIRSTRRVQVHHIQGTDGTQIRYTGSTGYTDPGYRTQRTDARCIISWSPTPTYHTQSTDVVPCPAHRIQGTD